jgi:hypothetical protein
MRGEKMKCKRLTEKQKDKLANIISKAVKYRTPRKKFMSVEQKDAYNKAVRQMEKVC